MSGQKTYLDQPPTKDDLPIISFFASQRRMPVLAGRDHHPSQTGQAGPQKGGLQPLFNVTQQAMYAADYMDLKEGAVPIVDPHLAHFNVVHNPNLEMELRHGRTENQTGTTFVPGKAMIRPAATSQCSCCAARSR